MPPRTLNAPVGVRFCASTSNRKPRGRRTSARRTAASAALLDGLAAPHSATRSSQRRSAPAWNFLAAAGALLDGRAGHRPVGAEHAAVAGLGPQQGMTVPAFIEILASVGGHCFLVLLTAVRAGDDGL